MLDLLFEQLRSIFINLECAIRYCFPVCRCVYLKVQYKVDGFRMVKTAKHYVI